MKIDNLELSCTVKEILDKFIPEVKEAGYPFFSQGYKYTNGYYMVQCPYHKFGKENHPSGEFSETDGTFWCFNCKELHQLPDVITYCLNTDGKLWLLDNFESSEIEERVTHFNFGNESKKSHNKSYVNPKVLDNYNKKHPYMYKRKLTDEVIEKFQIGYDECFKIDGYTADKVPITHNVGECITFPVKNEKGDIVFIARRAINQKFFFYPEGAEKPVYGLYEIYQEQKAGKQITDVYVCESMLDALAIWSWGKYAVALNGTGTKLQYEILQKSNIRNFILATDNDFAGQKARERFRQHIKNRLIREIDYTSYGTCKDINDMTKEQFLNAKIKF